MRAATAEGSACPALPARRGSRQDVQSIECREPNQRHEVDMPLAGVEQAKRPTARIELVLVMGELRQDMDEDVGNRNAARSRKPELRGVERRKASFLPSKWIAAKARATARRAERWLRWGCGFYSPGGLSRLAGCRARCAPSCRRATLTASSPQP